MTELTTRRTSARRPFDRCVVDPTHTAVEEAEHVFTAYREQVDRNHGPTWSKHSIRVNPDEGGDDEVVFTVTERSHDPKTNTVRTGFEYEVCRPVWGYRKPLSCDELESILRRWYREVHAPTDRAGNEVSSPV
ncbi:hypothetical protein SAMN04487950_2139 [Halogranum rubrum]|uniref:Uncharacterized protein n=1 Tax=Halogranum rubrum TaxID=553466 RepID=A0A1I4EF15_9EURY|nr:hypothetical protein [Halogranum rubrum]SFL04368.1 hypothetical protein SAMN04487950_2139 [Halogranum rubrum]